MSKSFLFRLGKDFLSIPKEIPFKIGMPILGIMAAGHLCYAIGTKEEKEIFVTKKYTFDRNGYTEFMVVDINGKHYNINNSLWYWKWNSIEDWSLIKENSTINAKFYGWRVPLFGIFPNIVNSNDYKCRI
jgi:hypothetical protein